METHKILFESLEKAEQHFEAGEIRNGQKIVNEVSRSIRAEGKVSNKLRHRFNFMSAQSRYFNDISSFATNPKRNEIIKETYQALNEKRSENYNFSGYIEGNHLMDGDVNVIVSDGFTGNVALKTAEGTANFITSELKKAMTGSIIGKISSLLNISNLKKFKKRLDPRLYNGAIFIGLDTPVVKSHGGTDYIGFSNSLDV